MVSYHANTSSEVHRKADIYWSPKNFDNDIGGIIPCKGSLN